MPAAVGQGAPTPGCMGVSLGLERLRGEEGMRMKKGLFRPVTALLLCALFWAVFAVSAKAETGRTRIATMPGGKDLTVMFSFDQENVDITFVSPSGNRIAKGDEGLEFAEGELWSTYRVAEAEAGDWWVEYDKGANEEIQYSVLEEAYGLWIQYVRLDGVEGEKLTAAFQADWENGDLRYDYELWAVNGQDDSLSVKLSSGSARANQEETVTASLKYLNSGHYTLKLEVSSREGDAELFDAMTGEEFDFTNANLPDAMQGAAIYLDVSSHTCRLDWKDVRSYDQKAYKVVAAVNGEEIYHGELDPSVTDTTIVYPAEGKDLQVSLFCKKSGLWSQPLVWNLDLQKGEALRAPAAEVTGEGQLLLEYTVSGERMLSLDVNGETGQFLLKESGQMGIGLQQGQNRIYGEFEGEGGVRYVLDKLVYYDALPPEILLYDNLDGKTFYEDHVDIIGVMEGGDSLTVNGEALELGEQGEFCYRLALSRGENVAELKAVDGNGNASLQTLTLYRGGGFGNGPVARAALKYLPLMAALAGSLLVILLAFLFLKKSEKKSPVKAAVAPEKKRPLAKWVCATVSLGILEAGCVWGYVWHWRFVRSLKYLETAEDSISRAARYLWLKRAFGVGAIAGFALFALCLAVVVVLAKRKGKKP